MTLSIPIIILIVINILGTGAEIARHGQPQKGRHNIFTVLLAQSILWGLLWWAGIFS